MSGRGCISAGSNDRAQPTARPVAFDGAAHLTRYRQADPSRSLVVTVARLYDKGAGIRL